MLPKISIITPSYNQAQFLEDTIQSVVTQDYPNFEYIIIDGGSTDDSVDIIRKYEKYLAYWVSEPDHGQTHAINKGIKRSGGDIIAYINSDDMYLPGAFEAISKQFLEKSEIDIVYGDHLIVDKNGKIIKKKRELGFDHTMCCMIGFGLIVTQPTAFMRRSIFNNVGIFDELYHYNMDSDFWFRCANNGAHFKHIPSYLVKFRWHDNAKSRISAESIRCMREKEYRSVLERSYNSLCISKIISFNYSWPVRKLYHLKRIVNKLVRGYYFLILENNIDDGED